VSALKEKIVRLIRAQGPVTVAHYMQIALGDSDAGYYMRANPIGRDFITAPEISQIFGELIGLLFVQVWEDCGCPKRFHLIELGPGRGTLMSDMLRAAKIRPAFLEAAEISLVETSPALRATQTDALAGVRAAWRNHLNEVPLGEPLFLVANEFFDALPAHQFVRAEHGWHERMVTAQDDALVFALAPEAVPAASFPPPHGQETRSYPTGAVFETSPASEGIVKEIAHRIAESGGVALIIDYGHAESGVGDTFQAVKDNRYADPLAEPGEADLTFHVDFAALADTARDAGAHVCGPQTQGEFLAALGIRARAARLKHASPELAGEIDAAVDRLTNPAQMGTLFKAMAICEGRGPGVPGFSC